MTSQLKILIMTALSLSLSCAPIFAAEFHVGPGKEFSAIGDVPWESLDAGDSVFIHWRSSPYQEKWVIGKSGTAQEPLLVSGVPGPEGQLPVIDGRNATTRQQLSYWNEKRGLLKIGGSSIPSDPLPSYIIIENLELRSARPPYTFTNDSGGQETYAKNAASFYVEIGQHLTIRNCKVHDSGNGIFIGANEGQTQDILIEGNHIYDNGIENSYYEHNTYTSAINITYQFNQMGALRSGALGNNLKDRSAGLVVRYNWIENGNRQLDLVDAEDSSAQVNHPSYHTTYVYGNVLKEADNQGNSQMIHYGGDSGNTSIYRKGTLYLYNNTFISTRSGNTTLIRLSTNDEFADVYNNLVYLTADGSRLGLVNEAGHITIRHNWFKSNWQVSHSSFSGAVIDDGTNLEGEDPEFSNFSQNDYHLVSSSRAINGGLALQPEVAGHPLLYQYLQHQQGEPRPNDMTLDIGAFETNETVVGDIDASGTVDLADVILSLRVLSGLQDGLSTQPGTDVGGDDRITMEEALFTLRLVAGLL